MPVSDPENRPALNAFFSEYLRPGMRVFEGGIGYGNIGRMIRAACPECQLIGAEIFEPYLTRGQHLVYDQIVLGDLSTVLSDAPDGWFDLSVLVDVVEHFDRESGTDILNQAKRASNAVLVSVPIIDYRQGPVNGNQYESHLTQWKSDELAALGFKALFLGRIVGVFSWRRK